LHDDRDFDPMVQFLGLAVIDITGDGDGGAYLAIERE
jgi:hypothetical protein